VKSLSSREKLYLGIFAVTLVWGVWNFRDTLFGDSAKVESTPAATSPPAAALAPPLNIQVAGFIPDQTYAVPEWDRDPFHRKWRNAPMQSAPTAVDDEERFDLRLTAVVIRPDVRYAVINGKILQVGQFIEGRKVVRIEETKVLLIDRGTEVTLKL